MNKLRQLFFISTLIMVFQVSAGCGSYLRGELICEVTDKADKVSMQLVTMGCEFPEGNRTNCIYAISCIDDKIFIGANRYQKISSSGSFCLTAEKEGDLLLKAFYSKKKGKRDFNVSLNCTKFNKEKENEVILTLGKTKKVCKLDKSLKKMKAEVKEPLVGVRQ